MWISPRLITRDLLRMLPLLALCLVAAGTSGCANPGPPRPPSLNLPSPVRDLQAERIGDSVRLAWTTPSQTTDEIPAKPPLSVEICREVGSGVLPAACTVVQRLAGHPGPSTAVDRLSAPLLTDPARLLHYRVRVLNASGRAADASNVAFAAAGAAPSTPSDLHSEPASAGTRILWQPTDLPATEVILQRSVIIPAAPAGTLPARSIPASTDRRQQASAEPVRLQAQAPGPDRGGTLDTSGQRGMTYHYVAWRTRSVTINGRQVALRSQDSAPLVVTVRDTTPPPAPTGLEAIVDGESVDLSWEPDTDADLAGYWVERAEGPIPHTSDAWRRVNQTALSAPAFRDSPPVGARDLQYRVLAADTAGNVSQPTGPISVRLSSRPAP